MTLSNLARTIAKARHGTDAMWANYLPSARAVSEVYERERQAIKDAMPREADYVQYAPLLRSRTARNRRR